MSAGSLIFVLVLVGGALAMFSMRRRGGHSHGVGGGCDGGGDGDGHGSSDRDGSAEEAREEESR